MSPPVFVSHSSLDKQRFVVPFVQRLQAAGVKVWFDDWELRPGDSLIDRIFTDGISESDVVIVVLSANTEDSNWVKNELNTAATRKIKGKCRIVPVILDDTEVPPILQDTVYQKISDCSSYDAEFSRILDGIHNSPSETAGTVATTAADRKATEVAQRIVEESTAEIRERIEQLETLRERQQRVEAKRHAATSQLIDKVREQPDFDSTLALLAEARMKDLFSPHFSLRCGSNQNLLMDLRIDERLLPLIATGELIDEDQICIEITVHSPTGTLPSAESYWWGGESIEEAWNGFLDACESKAVPMEGIGLTDVFAALAASYGVMIDARRSPVGDPMRLQGELRLLVNDEWVITSAGLESRLSNDRFEGTPAMPPNEDCPNGHDKSLWAEAVFYAYLFLAPF